MLVFNLFSNLNLHISISLLLLLVILYLSTCLLVISHILKDFVFLPNFSEMFTILNLYSVLLLCTNKFMYLKTLG